MSKTCGMLQDAISNFSTMWCSSIVLCAIGLLGCCAAQVVLGEADETCSMESKGLAHSLVWQNHWNCSDHFIFGQYFTIIINNYIQRLRFLGEIFFKKSIQVHPHVPQNKIVHIVYIFWFSADICGLCMKCSMSSCTQFSLIIQEFDVGIVICRLKSK